MSYPDIDDDNFYKIINKKYSRAYKIPNDTKTLKEFCFPSKFQLQIPQLFLAEYINPKSPYKGILAYHEIGSGKTCSMIRITENFIGKFNIIVVVPAALEGNFRSELRSQCAGNEYLTNSERILLNKLHPSSNEYKELIKKSDNRINKYYTIYSYDIFVRLLKQSKINFRNTLLVIDEIHNMVSETGTRYEELYAAVHSAHQSLRLVIMTATPIYNAPDEVALTMNLLLPKEKQLPIGRDFVKQFMDVKYTSNGPTYNIKNMDLFKESIKGYVSYYAGAPAHTYPRSEIFFVRTKMSDKQYKLYKKIIATESKSTKVKDYVNEEISNSFFIASRAVSNIVFPNNKVGEQGFDSMTADNYLISNMQILSPKFVKILRRIKKCEGTVFVYSNFLSYPGIKSFVEFLEHQHYKNYETNGVGEKRFAVWSGDESKLYKEEIKAVFNNKNNRNGSQIKIIIGSPATREGLSLLRLSEIHLIDVYWNFSRMRQIIGRGIRFCSHKDVPYSKQEVNVYIYLAVHPEIKISIDEYILKMALSKKDINKEFETALKESAVDCTLFANANSRPGDNIVCDV